MDTYEVSDESERKVLDSFEKDFNGSREIYARKVSTSQAMRARAIGSNLLLGLSSGPILAPEDVFKKLGLPNSGNGHAH